MSEATRVAAFFDVDRTLISVNSGELWVRHLWRSGRLSPAWALRSLLWIGQYRLGLLDFEGVIARVAADYRGRDAREVAAEITRFFDAEIASSLCVEGPQRIAEHRAAGHEVALLTSGSRFMAEPVAARLGVEHILCSELEIDDAGVLTGRHQPPACGGAGKIVHAERLAAALGVDLARSFFYTDSYTDLPMLAKVGHPRVINPDARLRRLARARGWEIEAWKPA
jgi:HAD superfamily hydrolase (TIGR01490 family)